MRNKTWLLMILILVIVAIVTIGLMLRNGVNDNGFENSGNENVIQAMNQPSPEQYKNLVVEILNEYGVNGDAEIAQSDLLDLRVPRELQDFHIDLVFAFTDGNSEVEIDARLSELANEVDWLSN